jgi:predicted HicB family RNase H-like nuclease
MSEKNLHIVISQQLHSRLKVTAALKGKSIKEYASEKLLDAINEDGL